MPLKAGPDRATVTARPAIPAGITAGGVVAIGRHAPVERAPAVAAGLVEGGVRAFEITLNEPEAEALRSIEAVARVAAILRHAADAAAPDTIR